MEEERSPKPKISFEKLAETSPAAIVEVDKDGQIVYANDRAEDVLGLEKSEITDRTYDDPDWRITDPEGNDFPSEKLPFQVVKLTEEPVEDVKHAIEWPDGERKLLSINATPLFDEEENFDGMVSVIEDITDQVEMREELKQGRERYHKYFEELGDAVFILAMGGEDHGKILEVNPTAVEQTGYSREELVGMNMIEDLSLEPPPDFDLEEADRKLSRGETVSFTEKKRKKNGDEYWTEVVVSPIEYQGKQANLSINRDITERVEARKELKSSEAKFRAMAEQAHDGLFIFTGDKLEWLNERASEILGYSKKELYKKSIWSFIHPEDRDRVKKIHKKGIEGIEAPSTYEAQLVRKDGEVRNCELAVTQIEYNGKQAFLGAARDVTERKKAEEESRESEKKYRQIFNNANDAIYLHGVTEEGLPGKFIEVNDIACQMLGYSREVFLSMSPRDIDAGEKAKDVPAITEELLSEGHNTFEMVHETKDGKSVPVEVSSHVFEMSGDRMVLSVARDITERKKLQKRQELVSHSLDQASLEVYWVKPDGRIVYTNEKVKDKLGYTEEKLKDMYVWDVDPNPGHSKDKREQRWKRLKKEGILNSESTHRTKDGETYPVEIVSHYVNYEGSEYEFVFAEDNTERKERKEKLKRSEKRYRTVFENTGTAMIIIEEDTTISLANEEVEKLSGYSKDEIEGRVSWTELVARDEDLEQMKEWHKARRDDPSAAPNQYEFKLADSEGNIKDVLITIDMIPGTKKSVASLSDITDQKNAQAKLRQSFIELAETTSRVLGVRDPYTEAHEQRVAELAKEVGRRMGLGEEKLLGLYIGGVLHDIGKIIVPETILTKPGDLKDVEWEMIKSHPKVGYNQILQDTDFPWPVAEMTLHHQERLDGSGYPDGLEGEELTKEVRILSAVDVVEAMSTRRPYREARTKERTLGVIREGKGVKFDPEVVDILVDMIEEEEVEFGGK